MTGELGIGAIRQRLGWSQEKLADYLGVDRSSISHHERGRPLTKPVQKLLRALIENPPHPPSPNAGNAA